MENGDVGISRNSTLFTIIGVHIGFLASTFAVPFLLSSSLTRFSILLVYGALFIVAATFSNFQIKLNSRSSKYLLMTTVAMGYISIVGFVNSYMHFGVRNALINFAITSSIFLYAVATFAQPHRQIRKIQNIFIAYALLSAGLSIMQYLNYAAIPLVNGYVNFKVAQSELSNLATDIFDGESGLLKPFGLFQDHLVNGFVLSVAAAFLMARINYENGRHNLLMLSAIIFLAFVEYLTHSRNSMLIFVAGLAVVFAFRFKTWRTLATQHTVLLSVAPLLIYLLLMASAVVHVIITGEFDSIAARVYSWSIVYLKYIVHGDIASILSGYGVSTYRDEQADPELWALDNTAVQVFMYAGLIGVLLFFAWWFWLSRQLLVMAAKFRTPELIGVYVLSVQYLLVGALNATAFALPVAPVLLTICYLCLGIRTEGHTAARNAR